MSYIVHDPQDVDFNGSDVNDLVFEYSLMNLNPDTTGLKITGIDPYGRAAAGTEIVLVNISTNPVEISHNSSASTSGNRFWFADGTSHTLGSYDMVWAIYKEAVPGRVGWWVETP